MIKTNLINILIVKKSIVLLGKSKNAEFDITNYQYLIGKLMYLLYTI